MSDTFDHCLDAYESMAHQDIHDEDCKSVSSNDTNQDKLFKTLTNIEVVQETDKAYRIKDGKFAFWVPKSVSYLHGNTIRIQGWFKLKYNAF